MSPAGNIYEVAKTVCEGIEELGLRYAIGGALAQNIWGTVRTTLDIDILVELPRIRFQQFADMVIGRGFHTVDGKGSAVPVTVPLLVAQERDRHLFVLIKDRVKVEVFIPFLPIQHSILNRAKSIAFEEKMVRMTPAEELIVLKLAFHREKDLRDVRAMLWSQQGLLDTTILRCWANQMLRAPVVAELEDWITLYHTPGGGTDRSSETPEPSAG